MGRQFEDLPDRLAGFIAEQKIFFVATATADSRVNLSPKGMESLRILGPRRAIWLNVTGSGNETAAHVRTHPRMTVMFCAFQGPPMILRLYGTARAVHPYDPDWGELYGHFTPLPGARQIFDLAIDLVQTSCGMAVPFMAYEGEREQLNVWAQAKGEEGIEAYWAEKNQVSLDGAPTHILGAAGGLAT
jgi:hypothetical protein